MNEEQFNYHSQRTYRALRRRFLEMRAKVAGKRFYCSALAGESDYNLCINSDMTVSCNCEDYDSSGQIGDLMYNSLEEVFASPKAKHFRHSMTSGRLPILKCASCSDLREATPEQALHHKENWKICTRGIMVENTVVCPYQCAACYRKLILGNRRSTHMTHDDLRKIAATIREYGIRSVSFFSLGEPFAVHDVSDQLRILLQVNPDLSVGISTNGLLLNTVNKLDAALLANHILFSIDGIDDHTMNKYQRGASFSKAYNNMKQLVEHRSKKGGSTPVIEWKYLLFNWNDREEMILQAIELAKHAGVDTISFWPTKSPFYGISWRYYCTPFFRSLGESSWKGREIHFTR